MKTRTKEKLGSDAFHRFAFGVAERVGSARAFAIALGVIAVWAISGPLFGFSDTWQLVINTGTTVVTFLMVFLIQATQNRDARAIHLKLDELIRTSKARNAFADLEHSTEEELERFEEEFRLMREKGHDRREAFRHAREHSRSAPMRGEHEHHAAHEHHEHGREAHEQPERERGEHDPRQREHPERDGHTH